MSNEYLNEAELKLVSALRSGNYKQASGQLHIVKDNSFCCLGVACDISGLGRWRGYDKSVYESRDGYDAYVTSLTPVVRNQLGWLDSNGRLIILAHRNEIITLSELNDEGFTFDQIADIIEAGLVQK